MKRFLVLFALLLALTCTGAAQSLCTITGTLYDSTGAACNGCRLTISRARSGSTPLSQGSQPVPANASGVVSFTAVQGSFITLTGPFTIGRYNLSGGLEFYVPLQSSATLATLQTAEDALNALISSTTYAPADIPVITKTASGSLSNEFALGSLATGLLKNTTTTGVPTIAVAGTDYENPLTFAARLSRSTNTIDLAASGVTAGTCTACDLTIDTYGRVTAKANGSGGGGGTWGSITGTLSSQTDLQSALDVKQGLDADLTAIGGLSPTNDDIIQRKAGAWTNRTVAQFKADLGLAAIATSGSASDLSAGTVPLARLAGITNTEIDNAAAIAYSKLNLTGAILNGDLAGSIANAKLANSAITIAGSSTSLGGSISASTILDSIGSTRGSVLYRGASGWAALGPGTSGQVLTSNGAGADPSYQAAAGGGITIGTTTITSGTNTRSLYNNAGVVGERAVTGTGDDVLSASPTLTGTVAMAAQTNSGTIVQTSSSATAFVSGASGSTNPSFTINNSIASQASGITVTGRADGTAPTVVTNSRTQITTALAGNGLAITADPAIAGSSVAGAAAGGSVTITAGDAARNTSGNANGGNIALIPGAGIGTGASGFIPIGGTTSSFPAIGFSTTAFAGQQGLAIFDGGGSVMRYLAVSNLVGTNIFANAGTPTAFRLGTGGNGLEMVSGFQLIWSSNASNALGTQDLFAGRAGAANLRFGAADAASPVAQTLSVQNVVGGTTNTAGANWTFAASRGTGTGAGGSIIFQTAPAGSSGTSQNSLSAAFTVNGDGSVSLKSVTFANLPTVANAKMIYCSDCTIASPCASGGSGAVAKGINGAWVCN